MKKINFAIAALAVVSMACTKEILPEKNSDNGNGETVKLVPFEFYAEADGCGSKTELGEGGTVKWLKNDNISLFTESGTNLKFTTANGDGWFTGEIPEGTTELYALYNYRTGSSFNTTDKYLQSKLFPSQTAKAGSFAENTAVMTGKVDMENKRVELRNMSSHIRFTLDETIAASGVRSLTLMGNDNELISGTYQVTFGPDGEPSFTVTDPDIYVTLRNSDESNLEAGDYYFTIHPTAFAKGFTVILSKSDGSQLAVKTDKNIDYTAQRNRILPMASVPMDKYAEHLNYFIQYNDGFDVTVGEGGYGAFTFNKTSYPEANFYFKGQRAGKPMSITAGGLYFIDPSFEGATIAMNAVNNLIICSSESGTRAKLTNTKALQPETNAEGVLAFENLDIVSTVSDMISQKKADANPGTAFGQIIFDNCRISTVRHLIYILNAKTAIGSISISNSDFTTAATGSNVISFGGTMDSEIETLNFYNNVCYYAGSASMTDFKILQAPAGSVNSIQVVNNTFDNTKIPNGGMVLAGNMSHCLIYKNIFYETVLTTANATVAQAKLTAPTTGQLTNNYYYTSSEKNLNPGLSANGDFKRGTPVRLTVSPLPETWNPAEGVYAGSYIEVPEGMGAKR